MCYYSLTVCYLISTLTSHNWPFTKTFIPVSTSDKRSHATHHVKNTSRSEEKTDSMPTDKTEQVTLDMKQSLSFQIWAFFKKFKQ